MVLTLRDLAAATSVQVRSWPPRLAKRVTENPFVSFTIGVRSSIWVCSCIVLSANCAAMTAQVASLTSPALGVRIELMVAKPSWPRTVSIVTAQPKSCCSTGRMRS